MRKTFVALALASSVMVAPCYARDGSAYVGLEGGASFGTGPDLVVYPAKSTVHAKTNTGWDADVVVGYDFGNFRLEAEGGYRESNIQQLIGEGGADVDRASAGVQPLASVDVGGVKIKSVMANALYDVGGDDGVSFYAGGGVGYAWTQLDAKIAGVVSPVVDDKSGGFAWQLLAGVRVPVTPNLELGAKYRLSNVSGGDFAGSGGNTYSTDFSSHSILASLVLNFGPGK